MAVVSEIAIAVPFTILPTGGVEVSDTQEKIWSDRVLAVTGTAIGERIHRHFFGSDVHTTLFNTVDEADNGLRAAIEAAFNTHLPLLNLSRVVTDYDNYDNILTATVFYRLPNDKEVQTTVGGVTISNNQPVREN